MILPLSKTDEQRLQFLEEAKAGNLESKDKLILSYLRYAATLAKEHSSGESREERIAVAFYALVKAINRLIITGSTNLKAIRKRIIGELRNARHAKTPSQLTTRRKKNTVCLGLEITLIDPKHNDPSSLPYANELRELISICAKSELESEFLKLLINGYTLKEISKMLNVDYKEVLKTRNIIKTRFITIFKD